MKTLKYLEYEKIVELNLLSVSIISVKKSDKHEVASKPKIEAVLEQCKEENGDIYHKAAALLTGLVRAHGFASANRRTAMFAAKYFLMQNGEKFKVEDNPEQAKILLGIREHYYTIDEIAEWLKNGKIREFRR